MKLKIFLLSLVFITTNAFCHFSQEDFLKTMQSIQSAQNKADPHSKTFERFLTDENRHFQALDFNIKGLTAISKLEPINRPGPAPDWGTDIFESMQFENIEFENCNFNYLNFSSAQFKNITFKKCNFEGTVFDEAILGDITFKDCNLKDASFCLASLNKVVFRESQASFANFMGADLQDVSFVLSYLQGSNFFGAVTASLSIQGSRENILFDERSKNVNVKKPIVIVSWSNKQPGLSTTKIVKKIQDLGGIPFKYNFKASDVDDLKLKQEIEFIALQVDADQTTSLPKKILAFAKGKNFPELSKIQKKAKSWVACVSGVIIPGGEDVHPFFYGESPHPKTGATNDLRHDLFEFAILDELESTDLPLFGVCRGMQIVNVWRGGSLTQHVDGHLFQVQNYHLTDPVKNEATGSVVEDIFRQTEGSFVGYSFHHQSVNQIGVGLKVVASAADGTIKALEGEENRFTVLTQWHPECKGDCSTTLAAQLDAKLSPGNHEFYQKFIEAARKKP